LKRELNFENMNIMEFVDLQLGRVFNEYKMLLTRISGFDIKGVCEIFERINQEGKRLKSMDLAISRSFHNYDCLTEEWV
jgi:hypothetical protein